MNHLMLYLELAIKLAMLMMMGIYFIFSNTIMTVLANYERGAGVMVDINKVIQNPIFLGIFALSGIGAIYLLFVAQGSELLAAWVFFIGTVLVTLRHNVPMNNQLQSTEHDIAARRRQWQHYLTHWVFWNHIRTLSSVISGVLLLQASLIS